MKKRAYYTVPAGLFAAVVVVAQTLSVAAKAADWTTADTRRVDRIVSRLLADPAEVRPRRARAISVSLSVNGVAVLEKGYGEAKPGVPATLDTRYLIGSVSKQFTAAAVLDAIEQGHRITGSRQALGLDTPVSSIFGGIDHWDQSGRRPLTVRRLLTMTSDLPNFTVRPPSGLDPWGAAPADHILGAFKKLRPTHSWAGEFRYSNTSYFLLAEILDRVAGPASIGYTSRLMDLFRRAEMQATGFVGAVRSMSELATPSYRRRPAFLKPDWLKGSGDLVSTVTDLRRWNSALMAGRIIGPVQRELMFSESAHVTPLRWYGMGWFIEERSDRMVYSHSGFVPGYTSLNVIVRSKKRPDLWHGIVILTNADEAYDLDRLADDLAHVLMDRSNLN